MVHKRPFIEDVFEVSCKQPRQAEHSNQWVLSSEPLFPEGAALFSNASGTEFLACNKLHMVHVGCYVGMLM